MRTCFRTWSVCASTSRPRIFNLITARIAEHKAREKRSLEAERVSITRARTGRRPNARSAARGIGDWNSSAPPKHAHRCRGQSEAKPLPPVTMTVTFSRRRSSQTGTAASQPEQSHGQARRNQCRPCSLSITAGGWHRSGSASCGQDPGGEAVPADDPPAVCTSAASLH